MAIVSLFRKWKMRFYDPPIVVWLYFLFEKKNPDAQTKSPFVNLCTLFLVPSSLTTQNNSIQHGCLSDACRLLSYFPFLQIKICRAFNHSSYYFFFLHPLSSWLISFDMFLFLNSLLKMLDPELDAILRVAYLLSVVCPTQNRQQLKILFI